MRKTFLALLTFVMSFPLFAQIAVEPLGNNTIRFRSLTTWNPPQEFSQPPYLTYFWMTSDGQFSQKDTALFRFPKTGTVEVKKKLRERYSTTDEPTPSSVVVTIPSDSAIVISPISNTPALTCRIIPEANQARLGDSVYIALLARNETQQMASGYMNFFFPLNAFTDRVEPHFVFPDFTTAAPPQAISYVDSWKAEANNLNGRVFSFAVNELAPFSEKAVFFVVKLKGGGELRDSTTHQLLLDWGLNRSDNKTLTDPDQGSSNIKLMSKKNEEGAENTSPAFAARDTAHITLNKARDPNELLVTPTHLYATAYMPPAQRGQPIKMQFTLNTENVGNAVVNHLKTSTYFDPRINMSATTAAAGTQKSCENRPSAPGSTPCNTTFSTSGQQADWNVDHILLAPKSAPDVALRQAQLVMNTQTKGSLTFNPGDKITSRALIKFLNRNGVVEDSVWTNYAITEFVKPSKARYGLTGGVKLHHSMDADLLTRGANLTLRMPLDLRRNPWERIPHSQPLPRWYWQVEAGLGESKCPTRQDTSIAISYNFVRLSPANLRYYHPVNVAQWFRYVGFTAGYSADLVLGALPVGMSSRSVHELAFTLDLSNRINVPAFTLGAGYKTRLGQDLPACDMAFVYMQADFVRFRKGFAKLWNQVKYH